MVDRSIASSGVQSLDRAVALLNTFSPERGRLSVAELATHNGLNRSTAHRLLAALEVHELVKKVPGTRTYALGPHTLRLATVATHETNIVQVALPIMVALRDETAETVGLHQLTEDHRRIVTAQAESRLPLRRTYTEVNEPVPIHQGGPGKVLLASLPEAEREAILERPLESATDRTIVSPDELRTELTGIRERGYAFSFEERVSGIHTVATAIRDYTERVVAALSVTGPASRLPEDRLRELAPIAGRAAGRISAELGYPGVTDGDG